jgi:hypothetical protein
MRYVPVEVEKASTVVTEQFEFQVLMRSFNSLSGTRFEVR